MKKYLPHALTLILVIGIIVLISGALSPIHTEAYGSMRAVSNGNDFTLEMTGYSFTENVCSVQMASADGRYKLSYRITLSEDRTGALTGKVTDVVLSKDGRVYTISTSYADPDQEISVRLDTCSLERFGEACCLQMSVHFNCFLKSGSDSIWFYETASLRFPFD